MALKNNTLMRRLIKKRDKVYDALVFNREYPGVVAALTDDKHEKAVRQQELESKKRLLPLEIASLSPENRNAVLYERELSDFNAAQELPRRAALQTYQRGKDTKNEADAAKRRDTALQALDAELEKKTAELKQKYPANAPGSAAAGALAAYERATGEEDVKMQALCARQRDEKQKTMDRLNTTLQAQNEKLQASFDETGKRLSALSVVGSETLGKGNILSIQNLKMYFSGIKAVDDLSFSIKEGEIFGLIGPNGAGKTTVFNCITQFNKPTEGNIYYKDRFSNAVSLLDYRTPEIIKAGISRTFQNLELVYWLSVLDNLLVGAHAFYRATLGDQFLHTGRLKREEDVFRQRAMDLLDRLGILEYKDFPPAGLPYGVLKKVELARTLMSNPRMIILDEPAAGLNDAETEGLSEIIRTIRDDFNCTIFLVEHDMNLVMDICDTVCAISFGKLLAIGTPEEIQGSRLVQEAYLGTE